jgi:putative transposase
MPSKKLKTPLSPDRYYHIYNRGNNKEKIFYHSGDYFSFLAKYKEYVAPYVKTYAFCLIPNHFHLLIKTGYNFNPPQLSIPNQLRKLFICHAQRINSMQRRTGALFTKSYQRIEIKEEAYLKQVVNYIHKNPVKHGVERNFKKYIYSSYKIILSDSETILARDQVLDWFGGKQAFIDFHYNDLTDPKTFGLLNLEENEIET